MKTKSKLLTLLDRENKIYVLKKKWAQLEEVENFLNQYKGKDLVVYCPYRVLNRKNYNAIDPNYGLYAYDGGTYLKEVKIPFINQIFTLEEMRRIIDIRFKAKDYTIPSYNEFTRRIREYIKVQRPTVDAVLEPLLKEVGEDCEV